MSEKVNGIRASIARLRNLAQPGEIIPIPKKKMIIVWKGARPAEMEHLSCMLKQNPEYIILNRDIKIYSLDHEGTWEVVNYIKGKTFKKKVKK